MNNDIAILLDLDNIVIGATEINLTFDVNIILTAIRELTQGRVVLRRAYGDWRQNKNMPKQLASAGFELQSAVRLSHSSKNLADMQLVVDAMETLIDGHNFSTYVIVTGDRDFLPLVQTLRKRGKQVIGVGIKHTTSKSLIDLCDEYLFYEDIAKEHGQQPFHQVEDLLQRALDELLSTHEPAQASLLKERMQSLSQGAFGSSPQGKKNFRKFLEQYPHLVKILQEGTTLYVVQPGQNGAAPTAIDQTEGEVEESEPSAIPPEEARALLEEASTQLLKEHPLVRASLLKERMRQLSHNRFDESLQGDDSFRSFLGRYNDVVAIKQSGTTLYVGAPEEETPVRELNIHYRAALKKKGLRVVPSEIRLAILKELILLLQQENEWRWKSIVDELALHFSKQDELQVSKSLIHDVIRLAKRSGVISQAGNQRSLASTVLKLEIEDDKVFQEAVMRCDSAYLQAIEKLPDEFDLEEASIALYNDSSYARYLKIVQGRFSQPEAPVQA